MEYPQQLLQMVQTCVVVWNIVAECEREGSLDTDIQEEVANLIRELCDSLLFVAELPLFQGILPVDMVREMDEWKQF